MPWMRLVSDPRKYSESYRDSKKGEKISLTQTKKGRYEAIDPSENDRQEALKILHHYYETRW